MSDFFAPADEPEPDEPEPEEGDGEAVEVGLEEGEAVGEAIGVGLEVGEAVGVAAAATTTAVRRSLDNPSSTPVNKSVLANVFITRVMVTPPLKAPS